MERMDKRPYSKSFSAGAVKITKRLSGAAAPMTSERFVAENVQNEAETSARDEIEQKVRETIQKHSYPRAQVHRFGSGATGLALKDADVDLVILGSGHNQ